MYCLYVLPLHTIFIYSYITIFLYSLHSKKHTIFVYFFYLIFFFNIPIDNIEKMWDKLSHVKGVSYEKSIDYRSNI
jgi:hypothetical protein